ncbi:MAG: membrane protein insertase YidC [Nitrosomonadales bacterium]|nr:membrane protein insertase YidC [Nitrosomonadales bacterium]
MDLQRLFLFLIFTFSLALVWDGWQRYQYPDQYVQESESANKKTENQKVVPSGELGHTIISQQSAVVRQSAQQESEQIIHVKTDTLEAEISTIGGDISYLALLEHPDGLDKNKPMVIFQRGEGTHNYVAQSGLLGTGLPNHTSAFIPEQYQYELAENAEQIRVQLKSVGGALEVSKTITFYKGSYLLGVSYEVNNVGPSPIKASSYFQLIRNSVAPEGSSKLLPTYIGAAVYTDKEKFQKIQFEDIEKGNAEYAKQADDGWIGILQHYFVAAWLPSDNGTHENFTRKLSGDQYAVGYISPEVTVESGQKTQIESKLYVGPAKTDLNQIAPGLGLTVDYGWLTIIATPIFWVMSLLNDWVHNWGVAIILLTVLIKLVFFPLSAASYRSMAKMRVVAPKLEKIKQQYPDDREQLNRAMMDLYKSEKINPLGGCLPVLIQIPVFIALYWAILSSVEMRYAPFFGWITDLSAADPYYVLPVIMGASMIIQMRLNPTPPDPLQAKVMQIMPIAFSIIFFFFPAGLVLYSIVNNLLSIGQQWYITRAAEKENKGATTKR